MEKRGFTLIELLIVVAIIAILAAIAIPNFLQAQTRAKVSRVRSDLRTVATGLESYYVDHNTYPHDYRSEGDSYPYYPTGLWALSTPIAYVSEGKFFDPFSIPDPESPPAFGDYLYTYLALTDDHDESGLYSIQLYGGDWYNPSEEELRNSAHWWVLKSAGPDGSIQWPDEYQPFGWEYMYDVPLHGDPDVMRNAIYDPTNGTVSFGMIYRAGGDTGNPVYPVIQASQ